MKNLLEILTGVGIFAITTIGGALPFYAAFKDFQNDQIFYAALDIVTVVLGFIRGLMYLFGGL